MILDRSLTCVFAKLLFCQGASSSFFATSRIAPTSSHFFAKAEWDMAGTGSYA